MRTTTRKKMKWKLDSMSLIPIPIELHFQEQSDLKN